MNTKDIGRKPRHRQPLWVETRGGKHYIFANGKPYILTSHVATGKLLYIYIYDKKMIQSNDEIHGPSACLILSKIAECISSI